MDELAPTEVKAGVEVAMIRLLDDGAQYDVEVAGEGQQVLHRRAVKPERAVHHQVSQKITGEAQFREDQQLDTGVDRLCDPLSVAGEVAIPIAEGGIDLRQPDRELAVRGHTSAGAGSRTPPPRASHWAMLGAI